MAIDTGYVDINNGNPGWNQKDVLDALETVFEQVGYHSSQGFPTGTSKQGVPHFVYGPNYTDQTESAGNNTWNTTGGSNDPFKNQRGDVDNTNSVAQYPWKPGTLKYRTFQPKANAENTGYYMMEYWNISTVTVADDMMNLTRRYTDQGTSGSSATHPSPNNAGYNDELTTGKAVVWRPDGTGTDYTNLVCGTTYYIISLRDVTAANGNTYGPSYIKLAASESDANNGTAIVLDGNLGSGSLNTMDLIIREPQDSNTLNKAIDTQMGDRLVFDFPSGNVGDFKLWHSYESEITGSGPTATSAYAADREISFANRDRFNPPTIRNASNNFSVNDYYKNFVCASTLTAANSNGWPVTTTNSISWNLEYWNQTEKTNNIDNFLRPDWMNSDDYQGSGYNYIDGNHSQKPISRYFYGNSTHSGMRAEINVAPNCNSSIANDARTHPYWDVTIAGDGAGVTGGGGAGKDLKLRVFRVNNVSANVGFITRIEILNMTDGWSNEAVFTIPGEDIGGEATTNDITFGVNATETTTNARDGKPSLAVTNIGGDTKFYQKSESGKYAILARDHTDTINSSNGQPIKKRSRTYYSFSFAWNATGDQKDAFLFVQSGIFYDFKNRPGTRYDNKDGTIDTNLSDSFSRGIFVGELGRDVQDGHRSVRTNWGGYQERDNYWSYVQIASETDPTGSPLRIYWNKPPTSGPQDKNCVLITFVGYSNSVPKTYHSFILNGGPNFMEPSPGVDLDNLFHGSITIIDSGNTFALATAGQGRGDTSYVTFRTMICGISNNQGHSTSREPFRNTANPNGRYISNASTSSFSAKTRDSLYGYMRSGNNGGYVGCIEKYGTPLLTEYRTSHDHMRIYYMNDTYDANDTNYYKPIKGIPISSNFIPCPYYLPDDFVLIYFGVGPSTTEFRYGDTITIGTSPNDEQYKVVVPAYDTNAQDWESTNSSTGSWSKGVALCVRTN